MSYRVLIADNVHEGCDAILKEKGIEVVREVGKSQEELEEMVGEFDGMVVRSAVKVREPLITKMNRMKVIGRAGAGVDNIDVEAATRRGILVMNTPGGNTISAAEHTLAMILSLSRNVPGANQSLHNSEWNRKAFVGRELMDKTVGILGIGRIGSEVAKRLRGFEVKLLGYDPMLADEAMKSLDIEPVDFDTIIKEADIISLHLPLNDKTRGMIAEEELAKMKHGALIINCARGGIVDESALLNALDEGRIGGAAFDVFAQEPPEFPSPLINHPHVVATPHIAASTAEAQERVALAIARQIGDFFQNGEGTGLVNGNGLEEALREEFTPFSDVACSLGHLVRELVGSQDLSVDMSVSGDKVLPLLHGLQASMLVGMFEKEEDGANLVNATVIAEQRGVKSTVTGQGPDNRYRFLLKASAVKGEEQHEVAVTLLGNTEPRLVMIDDHWLDIRPEGPMLLIYHQDKPGTLAAISGILGHADINIADLSLGRGGEGRNAMTLIRVDTEVHDEVLEQLQAIENVHHARSLLL